MNAKIIGFARWCRAQRIKHYPEKVAAGLRGTQAEDEQVAMIEAFCAKVRAGLDNATFEDKRGVVQFGGDFFRAIQIAATQSKVNLRSRIGEGRFCDVLLRFLTAWTSSPRM
jgi:hypothetical protein